MYEIVLEHLLSSRVFVPTKQNKQARGTGMAYPTLVQRLNSFFTWFLFFTNQSPIIQFEKSNVYRSQPLAQRTGAYTI